MPLLDWIDAYGILMLRRKICIIHLRTYIFLDISITLVELQVQEAYIATRRKSITLK